AARARREARREHGSVPASEDACDRLPRWMVLAGLVPLTRQRSPTVLAVPERDRIDDRLVRPAEPGPRTGSHASPPARCCLDRDTECLQDQIGVRLDDRGLELGRDEAGCLQPVTRHDEDDAVALTELTAAYGLAERAECDCGRRL